MYWGGSWNVAEFSANAYTKDKVDVAPLPKGEKQATIIHGVANVVSAKTEHPEQAWEFVKFLGSKEAAEILGKKGPLPAYTGTQDAWVKAHPGVQAADLPRRGRLRGAVPGLQEHRRLERGGARPTSPRRGPASEPVEQAATDLPKPMNDLLAKEMTWPSPPRRPAAAQAPPEKRRRRRDRAVEALWAYAFIAPTGLGLAVFYLWPVAADRLLLLHRVGRVRRPHLGRAGQLHAPARATPRSAGHCVNTADLHRARPASASPWRSCSPRCSTGRGCAGVAVYRTLYFLPVVTMPVAVAHGVEVALQR